MDEESLIGKPCLWRFTAETPKMLGIVDARALFPFLILLFWARPWTFYLALGSTTGFTILGLFRVSPISGIRSAALWIVTLGYRRSHLTHRRLRPSVSATFD
jgi:hypothetical protein